MKKIAFVGTDALLSGATLSMIALAKHLQETKEYNVIVIIPGHGEIEEYLKNNGLNY